VTAEENLSAPTYTAPFSSVFRPIWSGQLWFPVKILAALAEFDYFWMNWPTKNKKLKPTF
jgi:hypothetical protein